MGRSSRHVFVLGGSAAAACVGPFALAQLVRTPLPSKKLAVPRAAPSEVAQWEALVGKSFLIGGEAGRAVARLVMIERPSIDPRRPAELARFQPFTAWFETEARTAPAGQRTYKVSHPTQGMIELFLGRGADRRGKAVVYALFN